jgi:hypothetical protein
MSTIAKFDDFFGLSYRFPGALTHFLLFVYAPTLFLFFGFWIKSLPFMDDNGQKKAQR